MYYDNPNHTKDPTLLMKLLRNTQEIKGDVVEVGVYRAKKYLLFLKEAERQNKIAHAIDSFRGFSKPTKFDTFYKEGELDVGGADWLRKIVMSKKNARIHEGFIPKVLQRTGIYIISFIHIDVDIYLPTKQAIEWAWPLIAKGGIMICHDYLPGNKKNCSRAIDEFIEETGSVYIGLKNTWVWWIKK